MKKGDIKIDSNGISYKLIKRIGKGGQAPVWKVKDLNTKKYYAYKEYKHNKNNIKANIERLIENGEIKDKNGNPLKDIILPIALVECDGDSFGYVMELVDLKDFISIKKAWGPDYPSCEVICKIVQNFARVFETIHKTKGMCYKDVNEGNIFFNPKTGDIRVIDNDNIGLAEKFTIKGTSKYMAPEIILGDKPDTRSDSFSFAVFVYRLLIGGYPFEGPYTDAYCEKHDVLEDDAKKIIYGEKAIFVWDENNKLNSIENSTDPQLQGQAEFWKRLPESIKELFKKTFVTNLPKDRRAERTTDEEWSDTFKAIEKKLDTCPKCGKKTFTESGICFECGAALKIPPTTSSKSSSAQAKKQSSALTQKQGSAPATKTTKQQQHKKHKHKVQMKILSIGEAKREKEFFAADLMESSEISKNLPTGQLFKILYNKEKKVLGIKNLSKLSWTIVHADRTKEKCNPGEVQVLEENMRISIIPKTAQLNIAKLS